MNQVRPCGCKGCRTCLLCENQFGIKKKDFRDEFSKNFKSYSFCPECNKLYPGWDCWDIIASHSNHLVNNNGINLPGILVKYNFLSEEESDVIMEHIDKVPWQISQSGRRKQNFGPKTNFKKRKIQCGDFNGFPLFSKFIQDRFKQILILKDFQTIEQCTLEYDPEKGASIDPHVDDCWIWGERVVTVNCLGDSVLSLIKLKPTDKHKYNLDLVDNYKNELHNNLLSESEIDKFENILIRIPMPNLSLIVLSGPPRYQFEHCVLREDVEKRRVCLAYREFTKMYLDAGIDSEKGKSVIDKALNFWN